MNVTGQHAAGAEFSGGGRVAFFGGSFDPPHLGHLAVARAAQTALGLDAVLFAPVGAQPLKPRGSTASFADRLAMTRLAIADDPAFAVSLADAPRPAGGPNYTLETLAALRASLPEKSALFCLMGADSFAAFRRWHRAAEIPFVAPLIIAGRPGQPLNDLQASLPEGLSLEADPAPDIPSSSVEISAFRLRNPVGDSAPFFLLPSLQVEISASEIRALLRRHASAPESLEQEGNLIPAQVAEYIRARGLYASLAAGSGSD